MGMTKKAREYQEKMGTDMLSALLETDPEFAERLQTLHMTRWLTRMIWTTAPE